MIPIQLQKISFLLVLLLSVATYAYSETQYAEAQEPRDEGALQDAEPKPRWAVFDSLSREVGTLLGFSESGDSATIGFEFDGLNFLLEVNKDRIVGNTGGVFFESDDCSGTPLIIYKSTMAPLVAVAPPGSTVYLLVDDPRNPVSLTARSTLDPSSGECEKIKVEGLKLATARAILNLDRVFTPPFTIRLTRVPK
ncbi:MAG: hypothetical protein QXX77_09390 [Candidatus Methanosuratincola sp.]|jgi:hypothetical protein